MKNTNSHFILYAKGWYAKHNLINDMSILVADRCGGDSERIQERYIVSVLTEIVYPFLDSSEKFSKFTGNLIHYEYDFNNEFTAMERFIRTCLDVLMNLKVKSKDYSNEGIELDKPDYTILPESKNY